MFRIRMFEDTTPRRPVLDRLRVARRTRPLQIREVVQAVEEHLRAASLPSLESRYLPTSLTVRVAEEDWRVLLPFEDHLRAAIGETYDRLSEQPRLAALPAGPLVEFETSADLALGDVPELTSDFARRVCEASWSPEKGAPAPVREMAGGATVAFQILVTSNPRRGTARQSAVTVCLAPELPLRLLEPEADRETCLTLDDGGEIAGGKWSGGPPEELTAGSELVAVEGLERSAAPATVYRFRRSPAIEILWAPGGLLVLGREPERAHWAPPNAPPNLSSRHLALALTGPEELHAVDLRSTNGTFIGGERIAATAPTPLRLPARVEVGREGAMRLELHPLAPPEPGDRPTEIGS